MQEAYRPLCSKYSLCCPNWVPPWQGTPPSRVPPWQGIPQQGTPPPRQGIPPGRVPPSWTWQGTPPAGYPPSWTWQGTPPPTGPGRVSPPPGYPPAAPWHSGRCCKALWDMGTSPCGQTESWKDRRVSKHYLSRRTTYAGGKNHVNLESFKLYSISI